MKSEELLPAVAAALRQISERLEPGELRSIEKMLSEVKQALQSNDVRRLNEANADLDRATERAAALLVEQAMEAALERRGVK